MDKARRVVAVFLSVLALLKPNDSITNSLSLPET